MRVLIIKLTSMGDLMHAFPAITDAVGVISDIEFDWVVDESFQEVPLWHGAVKNTITTAHRRWKKNFIKVIKQGELKSFYQSLNEDDYDVIIDMQSNLKSAFVSFLRRDHVHGYDSKTCREWPAHWSYQHCYHVGLRQHAIERQRTLFAKIFNYEKPSTPADYGVDLANLPLPTMALPKKTLVFVHNASWPTKLWPIEHWQALIAKVAAKGYSVLLPCGSDSEYERAKTIASCHQAAIALPKMSLNDMAAILSRAHAAVCSDTGLAHMAAVTKTPAITLYAVTDTLLIGTMGENQQHIIAEGGIEHAAMADISVDDVFKKLEQILPESNENI